MVEAMWGPRLPLILAAVLAVGLGWHYLDRWATARQERFRREQARRRAEGRARGEVMARTGQHRAIRLVDPIPVSGPAPSLLTADQRVLIQTIRGLQQEVEALHRELEIRPDPDPILRALAVRPLSLSQVAATVGVPLDEAEQRLRRLIHITEQVRRVRPDGRGDWKFALRGRRSARTGTVPVHGKAG